jgi:L-rhamnose mutarotase
MNQLLFLLGIVFSLMITAAADTRVYELRVYYAPEGKLDDLHARFRNHTLKLFEKHGIQNIGYWVPLDNKENKLAYLLAYPSRDAREKSWKEFFADPDWQKAWKESEANGKLVARVDQFFLQPTDYSPVPKADASGNRVFEFRTYTNTTAPGRLENLDARFRDHTLKLFEKAGMQNIAYFHRMPDQKEAEVTLFYIIAHKDKAARDASFDSFRANPDWQKALKASEEKAGGSLTVKDGVKSELYKATDYSPIK